MALRRNILLFHSGALGDFSAHLAAGDGHRAGNGPEPRLLRHQPAEGICWPRKSCGWSRPTPRRGGIISFLNLRPCPSRRYDCWRGRKSSSTSWPTMQCLDAQCRDTRAGCASRHPVDRRAGRLRGTPVGLSASSNSSPIRSSRTGCSRCCARSNSAASPPGPPATRRSSTPASGGRIKCLRWSDLSNWLNTSPGGGKAAHHHRGSRAGTVEHSGDRSPGRRRRSQRPVDLLGLLSALSGANLFIGNDSGPGHLAGLLGIPTISLFGPTDPARWKPLGPKVRVLRGDPIESIAVTDVLKVIADTPPRSRARRVLPE